MGLPVDWSWKEMTRGAHPLISAAVKFANGTCAWAARHRSSSRYKKQCFLKVSGFFFRAGFAAVRLIKNRFFRRRIMDKGVAVVNDVVVFPATDSF